jgi:hypothetical protein
MSQAGKFWNTVKQQSKSMNQSPVQVGTVKTLNPLSIQFQGIELSYSNGDTIYINHLMLDENINLDVASMDSLQNIDPALWKADNSPTPTVSISGTQKQFLTDFYTWTKAVHDRYILHIGDYVAVQKLGNNTYLVLEKVQKVEQ